jgi:hypothetical protein
MRELATGDRIRQFFRELGRRTRNPATVYLTGGATAVLLGWRESTIDIVVKLVPDNDELLRQIPALKEELHINVELASPDLFVPVRDGWEDRSPWETTEGRIVVRHFDLYAQALSKVERGHERDRGDVQEMLRRGLITAGGLADYFADVEPFAFRYPAIDAAALGQRISELGSAS